MPAKSLLKVSPPETPAQSKPATMWYPFRDLNLSSMADKNTLQKHEKSISTMESKLSSVEENQVATKEQITELKDQFAQMHQENTDMKRSVLELMELVRTELQKKTPEAGEGSILISRYKEVNSSTDSVEQAPDMAPTPHPEVPPSETPVQSKPVVPEEALFKIRVQEYAQKAAIRLPLHYTINEGTPHAPMYRSAVVFNGATYTSPNVFVDQKSADMDAARITLLSLAPQINEEHCLLQQEDNLNCKSILNEYAVKINVEKPIYNSEIADILPPAFVSSLTFNGKHYVGDQGRKKKESQQLAARAVILSILDSDARTIISKIIVNYKKRLSAAKDKVKYPCNTQNEVMPVGIQTETNVGTSVSKGNELKVVVNENMPRTDIPEPSGNSTSVSAKSVPLHEFRLPKEEASAVEANGTPLIYTPPNLQQLAVESTSVKRKSTKAKNNVGIHAQVQIAALPSSQTCTVAQSVPNNCVSLQAFDNVVLSGPCVLPKLRSGSETHILVYWRKPAEGFIALNTDGALQNGIAAGGGILRNHIGEHISNFYNNYGRGSCNIAESRAILDGLSVCKELGYNKIQIQTDSLHATLCFDRQLKIPLPLQSIWDEIYKFQDTLSIEIMHVYREGNKMADYLSKKGILAEGMGAINISLDKRAKELLTREKLGISYLRKLKNQFAEGMHESLMNTGAQIAAVPSSRTTTCTVAQSVPDNCVSQQGFHNTVLCGPCVLPKRKSGSETHFLVYWRKPPEGYIALNTHGALQSGIAAGGGVLRNHFGEHISNFYNNYGRVSIEFAESKAILDGLFVCKELGFNKIRIQTDSAHATLWFHRQLTVTVPLDLQTIWNEIYKFQDTLSIEILHVHKEGNKLAELLSRKGISAEGMGAINISLDLRAKELLVGGKLGLSYLRKLKTQSAA